MVATEIETSNKLEKILRQCVDDVKAEIQKKRNDKKSVYSKFPLYLKPFSHKATKRTFGVTRRPKPHSNWAWEDNPSSSVPGKGSHFTLRQDIPSKTEIIFSISKTLKWFGCLKLREHAQHKPSVIKIVWRRRLRWKRRRTAREGNWAGHSLRNCKNKCIRLNAWENDSDQYGFEIETTNSSWSKETPSRRKAETYNSNCNQQLSFCILLKIN
jgi:hypothetical protein